MGAFVLIRVGIASISVQDFHSLLGALAGATVDALAGFDRHTALSAGMSPARVQEWKLVHDAYFGSTRAPAKQREAADRARRGGLPIDVLAQIERCIAHIDDTTQRHGFRMQLLAAAGAATTCAQIARVAKSIVPPRAAAPEKRVTFTASRLGMRTMAVTADERLIADVEHALTQGVDTSQPVAPQLADRFAEMVRTGGGVAAAVPRPLLLVGLPDHVRIVRGEGDDVVLGLTDGTTITGADYLNSVVATADNELEAALFHPAEGAVNLYRGERFANQKQRDLARAVSPVCAGPDCRHGADSCEIHHIVAWSEGGETNMSNLATLCRYHNRVNDDVPGKKRRGRIEMIRGAPVWVSPRGYAVRNTRHPFGAMETLFGSPPG